MLRKVAIVVGTLAVAFVILFTSVVRTAAVKYAFSEAYASTNEVTQVLGEETVSVSYTLAFPGRVLPDSPFWPIKALRDKVWLWITTNPSREAELKLLFADKRLAMSQLLFDKENYEVGYSTLTKAEKYLEEAGLAERESREAGMDTSEFLERLATAALYHYQVMEEIKSKTPEDVHPSIIQTQDYSKNVYEGSRNALLEIGLETPENPFDWN